MQTIVEKVTNLSKYLFDDAEVVVLNDNNIVVGDPVTLIITDLNINTVTLYEGVTTPEDWTGDKYFFDGTDWTLNPEWFVPAVQVEDATS